MTTSPSLPTREFAETESAKSPLLCIKIEWAIDQTQEGQAANMGTMLLRTQNLPTQTAWALVIDRQAFDRLGWDSVRLQQEWSTAWNTLNAWDSKKAKTHFCLPRQPSIKKKGFLSFVHAFAALRHQKPMEAASMTPPLVAQDPLIATWLLSQQISQKKGALSSTLRGYEALSANEQLCCMLQRLAQLLNAAGPSPWVLETAMPAKEIEQHPAVCAWLERRKLSQLMAADAPPSSSSGGDRLAPAEPTTATSTTRIRRL